MFVFFLILFSLVAGDLFWWWWADRQMRPLPQARRWRWIVGLFMGVQIAGYVWVIGSRMVGVHAANIPLVTASTYIWHLVILPPATLAVIFIGSGCSAFSFLTSLIRPRVPQPVSPAGEFAAEVPAGSEDTVAAAPGLSRRQMLVSAAALVPPLLLPAAVGRAMSQLDEFRIRRLDLRIPGLPAPLSGLTIAHLSDTHVGRFTTPEVLRIIAEKTNQLKADLVLFTGDLIDYTLRDLPAGLDFLKQLDPRYGVFLCEGNHDLFESRQGFEQGVKSAGYPMLINEERTLEIHSMPLQILGLKWGGRGERRNANVDEWMQVIGQIRNPDAFSILLAHHPHAFDRAVEQGIPLTLAGHTHGGQLMLTQDVGPGPLLYKYWSGLYQRANSSLVVSNGTGNWFPLRINAPAEIVHITLRQS